MTNRADCNAALREKPRRQQATLEADMTNTNFYPLARLESERAQARQPYLEFLRVPAMSAGIYVLSPGQTDSQSPHAEDELYCVLRGQARMRVGLEDRAVGPGVLIFVGAGVEHRFYEISEELLVLVCFAPAESG
jgi:mannose-6-phosphate isomerase-like protein (cupin superfamily)